jgi:hypothetical protein
MSDLRQSDSVIAKDFFDNKDENNEFRIWPSFGHIFIARKYINDNLTVIRM